MADSSPAAIENMIIPNGVENGMQVGRSASTTTNAAGGYVADYVTVNAMLPGYSSGSLVYAQAGCGRQLVDAADREGVCPVERDRPARAATARTPTRVSAGGWMQAVDAQVLGCAAATYCPA